MKPSLIVLFLTILLLCGVLLRAAGNRCTTRTQHVQEAVTEVKVKKDMQLVPNVILL